MLPHSMQAADYKLSTKESDQGFIPHNSSVQMYNTGVPIANGPSVMIQTYIGDCIWADNTAIITGWDKAYEQ